jgi:hypothetical protein
MDDERQTKETGRLPKLRFLAVCVSTTMGVLFSLSFMIFLATLMWRQEPWLIAFAKEHPGAAILLPLAGIAAYCVVTLLEYQSGNIQFEVAKMKFKGASGTIVFWVFAFLAMAIGIRITW